MILQQKRLALAISGLFLTSHAIAADTDTTPALDTTLPPIVVTAEPMDEPLKVVTDPKTPRQPLPAHDGADYLKTIPGFNVTRKSGTDGDPVFRGMAGSRLGIMVDGENILGGCNARMDAPTAYIYPEMYDVLTVIKGPQTVLYGAGSSAATVLFERKPEEFSEPGYRLHASALLGSFGRHDELVDGALGNQTGYMRFTANNSASDDYEDGDGNTVHSEYERYSGNLALGWTPDANTTAELSATRSDGEAAYADRSMDGTKFLRESSNLKITKENISDLIAGIEAKFYDNSVDHIMDDQTLRAPGMMGYINLMRETTGGKVAATLHVNNNAQLTVGADKQDNEHRSRTAPAMTGVYTAWTHDAEFSQYGLFAEINYDLDAQNRIVAGYRHDNWEATDLRSMIMTAMMPLTMQMNPTAGDTRSESLNSGFARIEHQLNESNTTVFAGLGHSERFPDYWEMISKQGAESSTDYSAFNDIQSETTNQLDAGMLYKSDTMDASISLFYNEISDFILIDYSAPMMGTNAFRANGFSRNIDAHSYGAEAGLNYAINNNWKSETTVAMVRGTNETDDSALPQLPPLEVRLGLNYAQANWTSGGLVRWVNDQNHYDTSMGNIVGKDIGPGEGFTVFSLNAGWKPGKNSLISAGVDNLFDETYAEFISRAGSNVTGYVQTTRVNEPGRTLWVKAQISFD
jgi:iron complex outermembrane receptor protein